MKLYRNHKLIKSTALLLLVCLLFSLALTGCQKKGGEGADNSGNSGGTGSENTGSENASSGTELPVLDKPLSNSAFLLNTFVTVTLYDRGNEEVIQNCFELCQKYEELLSRTIPTSEISKLNDAANYPVTVSEDTAALLSKALYYSEISDGAFDLTIAPLSSIWDFVSLEPVKPSDDAIAEAIRHIDYKNVQIDGQDITLTDPDTAIELGAIAKGFIADRIKDYLLSQGVGSAIIDLGGNILCVGSKPDGSGFKIGIQKPFEDRNETIAAVELHDLSVVSSGIYERCFRENDEFYHHILNPDTGYPYDNGLISVTIISKESVDGDGLSTTCFSLGLEKGMELINSLPDTYAVFITDDYELHYSEGFEKNLKILN